MKIIYFILQDYLNKVLSSKISFYMMKPFETVNFDETQMLITTFAGNANENRSRWINLVVLCKTNSTKNLQI